MLNFDEIMKYAPNNDAVFQKLKERTAEYNIIPYVGSGLSTFAGFPTWGKFLNDLEKDLKEYKGLTPPTGLNFLERADWITSNMGQKRFIKRINETFNPADDKFWEGITAEAEKKSALFLLPWLFRDCVVTTNYDRLIESVYSKMKRFPAAHAISYYDLNQKLIEEKNHQPDNNPFVYKIHGSILTPDKIILGQQSYDNAYKDNSPFVNALKTIFASKSMLFLGSSISLNDRPIELLHQMCGETVKHFAIIPCKDGNQESLYSEMAENFNITPLLYENKKHDSVRIILEVLLKEISPTDYNSLDYRLSSPTIPRNEKNYFRHDCSNPVNFVGRKNEIKELEEFLNNEEPVLWWAITGEGGSGKTRLVDQLIKILDTKWSVKRLDIQEPEEFKNIKEDRRSYKPTLIVIDYVFAYYKRVAELLVELSKDKAAIHKTRVLLLERNSEIQIVNALRGSLAMSTKRDIVKNSHYKEKDLYIEPLSHSDLMSLMHDYLLRYYEIEENEATLREMLLKLEKIDTKLLRPLYAMFIADARGNDKPIGKWKKKDFLEYVVERERDPTELALSDINTKLENDVIKKHIEKAKAYAVFVKGVSTQEYFSSIYPDADEYLSSFCYRLGVERDDFLNRIWLTQDNNILSFQPDIVGEYYLLKFLEGQLEKGKEKEKGKNQEIKDFIGKAWYHPRRASDVMFRLLNDFKKNAQEDDVVISDDLYTLLTNIEIPDGIKEIPRDAFLGCYFLKSIRLPNSVADIHASAFKNCINLEQVCLPESLPRISFGTFSNCRLLKTIELPAAIKSIGDTAFEDCSALADINISDTEIEKIGEYTFKNCGNLTKILFPDCLKDIGKEAFSHCVKLESVVFNEPLNSLDSFAFECCDSLREVDASKGAEIIGRFTFADCKSLNTVKLKETKSIGQYAFLECVALETIEIPDTVDTIGDGCFENCVNLTTINLPDQINTICEYCFAGCKMLSNIILPPMLEYINHLSFARSGLKEITIPSICKRIGAAAFGQCSALKKVTIQGETTDIEKKGFSGCSIEKTNINASKWQKKKIFNSFEERYAYRPINERSDVGKDYKPPKKRKRPRQDIIE